MRIILLTLIAFACSSEKREPIATLSLNELEIDFNELTPLDSIELTFMIETHIQNEWTPVHNEIVNNMPKAYVDNFLNIPEWKNEFIDTYLNMYKSYWIELKIDGQSKGFIISTTGIDPKNWMNDPYELKLYYPNKGENQLKPILIACYRHLMGGEVETEEIPIIQFFKDGDIKVVSKSGSCYDIITDQGIDCWTITITNKFGTISNDLQMISSDTVRSEEKGIVL